MAEIDRLERAYEEAAERTGANRMVRLLVKYGMSDMAQHCENTGRGFVRSARKLNAPPKFCIIGGVVLLLHDVGKLCRQQMVKKPIKLPRPVIQRNNIHHTWSSGLIISENFCPIDKYPEAENRAVMFARNHHGDLHGDGLPLHLDDLNTLLLGRFVDIGEATQTLVGREYRDDGPVPKEKILSTMYDVVTGTERILGAPVDEVAELVVDEMYVVLQGRQRYLEEAA